MINLILTSMLVSMPPVDKVAHFGISYAMTHSCEVVFRKTTNVSKTTSTIVCASAALAVGGARELMGNKDPEDMLANAAGIGFAVTIISIDW